MQMIYSSSFAIIGTTSRSVDTFRNSLRRNYLTACSIFSAKSNISKNIRIRQRQQWKTIIHPKQKTPLLAHRCDRLNRRMLNRQKCSYTSIGSILDSSRGISNIDLKELIEKEQEINYNDIMKQHVRTCLSSSTGKDEEAEEGKRISDHTGFVVSFLGTGGGIPNTKRLTSSTLLRLGGQSFLFDAGEGIQRQLMFTRIQLSQISKIFITHLHADHIFGLTGLLLTLRMASKSSKKGVEIYGPPGLYNYIASSITLSCSAYTDFTVNVYELVGGQHSSGPQFKKYQRNKNSNSNGNRRGQPGSWTDSHNQREKNIFLDWYPELSSPWLLRRRIPRNKDGTWTISSPTEIVSSSDDNIMKGEQQYSNDVSGGARRQFHITAAEVTHLPGVQTFGFAVKELEPPKKIDPAKAIKLGVKPGKKYRLLKNGKSVLSDDGTLEVQPKDVLLDATSKARKFVLIGDNCALSPQMKQLCTDADVFIHEATVMEGRTDATTGRGHSTAEMAGRLAKEVNSDVLILNHLSGIIQTTQDRMDLKSRAEWTNGSVSEVVVADDFMEISVPRLGFKQKQRDDEEEGFRSSIDLHLAARMNGEFNRPVPDATFLSWCTSGFPSPPYDTPTKSSLHLDAAIVVPDYDEAIRYYCNNLGFNLVEDDSHPEEKEKRWVIVSSSSGTTTSTSLLVVVPNTNPKMDLVNTKRNESAYGNAFLLLRSENIWRDYKAMKSKGIRFEQEPKEERYGTVAVFTDLHGNTWDLIQLSKIR